MPNARMLNPLVLCLGPRALNETLGILVEGLEMRLQASRIETLNAQKICWLENIDSGNPETQAK